MSFGYKLKTKIVSGISNFRGGAGASLGFLFRQGDQLALFAWDSVVSWDSRVAVLNPQSPGPTWSP